MIIIKKNVFSIITFEKVITKSGVHLGTLIDKIIITTTKKKKTKTIILLIMTNLKKFDITNFKLFYKENKTKKKKG